MDRLVDLTERVARSERLDDDSVREIANLTRANPRPLIEAASVSRDSITGPRITYSRKVFIPLTKLCRDSCGYCTFAHPPVPGEDPFLTIDEVLAIARAGEAAGCNEALF